MVFSKNAPIGFFDSGVGGLSVYSRFRELLPNENSIYFGDLKNMPYGNKTREELVGFARNILNFFKTKNVKAVVIACNTSSAVAYDIVKDEYEFKIYPIIQSCAKVISALSVKNIGVFATAATVASHAYKKEINKYNPSISVTEIACPKWTNFVEEDLIKSSECNDDIRAQIDIMMESNPDKIVLGCTHYPYLMSILTKYAPKHLFIDPAEIFVDYIKSDLQGNLNDFGEISTEEFYASATPEIFVNNAKLFYNVNNCKLLS